MSGITVKLSQHITAHGQELSEITLREPTTKDVIELGLPTLIIPSEDGKSAGVEVRQRVVARYIMKLAAIPLGAVESLSMHDFSTCTAAVMGFFGQGDGEVSES